MGLSPLEAEGYRSPASELDQAWSDFYGARACERERRRHLAEVLEMACAAEQDHAEAESQLKDAYTKLALKFRRTMGRDLPTVGIHTISHAHVDDAR